MIYIYGCLNQFSLCMPASRGFFRTRTVYDACAGVRPNSITHGFVQEPHNMYLISFAYNTSKGRYLRISRGIS